MRFRTVAFGFGLAIWVPAPGQAIEVQLNRPRNEFQCDTPLGVDWYGSIQRCLEELCAGKNVTNEYIFDQATRRRRNPCYGQNPTAVGQ